MFFPDLYQKGSRWTKMGKQSVGGIFFQIYIFRYPEAGKGGVRKHIFTILNFWISGSGGKEVWEDIIL